MMEWNDDVGRGEELDDGELTERCPVCRRVNRPGEDDVCGHFVCLLWDAEPLAGDERWREAFDAATAAVERLDDPSVEALEAQVRGTPLGRVLKAVYEGERDWWIEEAEVHVWPVEDQPVSGTTRSVFHRDATWYPSVLARMRELEREARSVLDGLAVRANLEWLEQRAARKRAVARSRRETLHRRKSGEVLLSHNHVILLHALYDRPGGVAPSVGDWARATVPYRRAFGIEASEWSMRRAMRTIGAALVRRRRRGRCIEAALTETGRGILERTVPAYVRGYGAYAGLGRRRWSDERG